MPERSNQHFVPQFYFRHFSGSDAICLLLRDTGKVILNAAIKGQCAKKNFYGSKELESLFSELESIHAQVVRRTIQVSWDETEMIFGHEEYCKLLQAILFQRARTSLETTKKAAAPAIMFLKLFRNHLEQIGEYKLVREIDEGNIKVLPNDRVIVALRWAPQLDNRSGCIR